MITFAPVPPKPDDLVVQTNVKGKLKLTLEDGTEEIYSMKDVTNVRRIAQTEGRVSSSDSGLNVNPDQMMQNIGSDDSQQPQQIQVHQHQTPSYVSPQPAVPAMVLAQPAVPANVQPQTVFGLGTTPGLPPTVQNFPMINRPTVMHPHQPSSVYHQQRSLAAMSGPARHGSTSSLPCYYPSTWAMPSQSNLAATSR